MFQSPRHSLDGQHAQHYSLPSLPVHGGHFEKPRSTIGTVILNFIPSWFAVNMGTGIISILLHMAPHSFRGLEQIALAFYVLNVVLFVLFSALSIVRYIMFPWVVWRMLSNPPICMFLGCVPMALCTVINATILMVVPICGPWIVVIVQVLWWLEVALTTLSSFAIPILMFNIHDLEMESMTATWLLPIVPAVVAPASGALVAGLVGPGSALVSIVVSYMLWGVGMGLSGIIMVLYFYRLAVHNIPDGEVVVSAFLPLGPFGMGGWTLMLLAHAGKDVFPAMSFAGSVTAAADIWVVSVLVALILWGLGWWWLLHGLSSVLIRHYQGGIVFTMGFWGFVFPLGVFTASTIALSEALPSIFLSWLAMVLIVILLLLWCFVAAGTVINVVNGKLLMGPCLQEGPSNDSAWVAQDTI